MAERLTPPPDREKREPAKPQLKPPATKAKPGRPKKGQSHVTPDVQEIIARGWLRCKTLNEIANESGVSTDTVRRIVANVLQPIWQQKLWTDLQIDLAKVDHIEEVAWKDFEESHEREALANAKWAIEHRAKIAGHYAPSRLDIGQRLEVRVAGVAPADFDGETVQMILVQIQERRKLQKAIELGG